jgi:hypothetical protein
MTARTFTCPNCFKTAFFSDIEANNYACSNPNCILSERLVVHSELNPKGQATKIYGWVLEPGELLHGKYEIIRLLGKGGYGATYEAKYREMLKQTFAIKETPRLYCDDEEDEFLLNLNHPGIPKLYERFNIGDLHYIIMEFIEGENLQEIIHNRPQVGLEPLILKIAEQVCDVLAHIHAENVIHRDLKPENILVRRNGSVAIVDFGIAKRFVPGVQTRHLARAASQFYSPPEQYDTGKGVTDPRSDIYSLGAILYFLLTGREPIDANNRKFNEPLAPLPSQMNPNISNRLEEVVVRAMSMKASDRYPNIGEMKKALLNAGVVSTRICPSCGRIYRGVKNLCHKCGGPTNPLGGAANSPFVFRSGEKASNLQEFIQACYNQWDDAIWHLYHGDFEPWLNSIQEGALAERAANIRHLLENRNLGLNQFLMNSLFSRPPKMDLSHNKIDFLSVKPGTQKRLVLTIQNPGHGFLQGELQGDSAYISADNYAFSCFAGESKHITLTLQVNQYLYPKTIQTNLRIETNIGTKIIPVTITTETPAPQWKITPEPLDIQILQNQTGITGFSVEVITSQGKLDGTVKTTVPWITARPTSFSGRSQLIRLEINTTGITPGRYKTTIEINTSFGKKNLDLQILVKAPTPVKIKKPLPWRPIAKSQLAPSLFFIALFWLLCAFFPQKNVMSPDSFQVFFFTGLGVVFGLSDFVRREIKSWFVSLLVGILLGLVLSATWKYLSFLIISAVRTTLLTPVNAWLKLPSTQLLEFVILFFLGIICGGLWGLARSVYKFKPTSSDLFAYTLIFLLVLVSLSLGTLTLLGMYLK